MVNLKDYFLQERNRVLISKKEANKSYKRREILYNKLTPRQKLFDGIQSKRDKKDRINSHEINRRLKPN